MSRVQYNRTPCPGRVFDDLGQGFAMGCFGGSLLYFVKGNSLKTNLFRRLERSQKIEIILRFVSR